MSITRRPKLADRKPAVEKREFQVLIVDDDLDIAVTFRHILKVAGYGSYLALNGDEALAYIEAKKPDLVILDIMMPKRSGLLVLEMIRQKILEPLPVIVITGNLGSRHREYAEMLGVQGYLHKPITLDRLVDAVDEILRPQEARSGRD